jgi:hypothetical protein
MAFRPVTEWPVMTKTMLADRALTRVAFSLWRTRERDQLSQAGFIHGSFMSHYFESAPGRRLMRCAVWTRVITPARAASKRKFMRAILALGLDCVSATPQVSVANIPPRMICPVGPC